MVPRNNKNGGLLLGCSSLFLFLLEEGCVLPYSTFSITIPIFLSSCKSQPEFLIMNSGRFDNCSLVTAVVPYTAVRSYAWARVSYIPYMPGTYLLQGAIYSRVSIYQQNRPADYYGGP